MGEYSCFGCGKTVWGLVDYESHAKKCSRFLLIPIEPDMTIVQRRDLSSLRVRQLPNGQAWGRWNKNTDDWVRDKQGEVETRVVEDDIKEVLSYIIATSLLRISRPSSSRSWGFPS